MTSQQRRRLSVDSRRDELLAAAQEIFATTPPDEVNINDIAAAAGASRALVYHYFGGKQELYIAAMRQTADELTASLTEPIEGSVIEQVSEALKRYFDFAELRAAGFVALLRGGAGDEASAIAEDVRQILLDSLIVGTEIEHPSPILRITLHGWMAAVETSVIDWLVARVPERSVLEELLVQQLAGMLLAAANHDPDVATFVTTLV